MKECVLFDPDGVLVETEFWYFRAGQRALLRSVWPWTRSSTSAI